MVANQFPEPFDENYSPPNLQEKGEASDAFDEIVEDAVLRHATSVRTSEPNQDGIVTNRLDLESTDGTDAVDVLVSKIEGDILRSSIVYIHWLSGARQKSGAAYIRDVSTGDAIRRDISPEAGEQTARRVEEVLDRPVSAEQDEDSIRAASIQVGAEQSGNVAFEQAQGLNSLPVHLKEINWLRAIVAAGRAKTRK